MKLLSAPMDLGENDFLFCSALQLQTCYELLLGEVEEVVQEGDVVRGEDCRVRQKLFSK